MSEARWDEDLRAQGFSGLHLCFRDSDKEHYSKSLMVSMVSPMTQPDPVQNVVVIKPTTPDAVTDTLANNLSRVLSESGTKGVEVITLAESKTMDLDGKFCIVTLEANRPFLFGMAKEEDFDAIKRTILKSTNILWLTRGGTMESTYPEANMITGLARTIRGENPNIRMTTLDLDPAQPLDSQNVADVICRIVNVKNDESNVEFEYAVRDSKVHVLRLHTSKELSDIFKNKDEHAVASSAQVETVSLKQTKGRALKRGGR